MLNAVNHELLCQTLAAARSSCDGCEILYVFGRLPSVNALVPFTIVLSRACARGVSWGQVVVFPLEGVRELDA